MWTFVHGTARLRSRFDCAGVLDGSNVYDVCSAECVSTSVAQSDPCACTLPGSECAVRPGYNVLHIPADSIPAPDPFLACPEGEWPEETRSHCAPLDCMGVPGGAARYDGLCEACIQRAGCRRVRVLVWLLARHSR